MNNKYAAHLSEELKFILKLVSNHSDQLQSTDYESLDWDLFMEYALHHRLFPSLYIKLKDLEIIPKHVKSRLAAVYKENTFEMMRLCREMELINLLCKEKNIRLLFLKGPIIAHQLYGDLSLRTSCDLDLLVSLQDLDKLERLLSSQGYIKDDYIQTILSDWKWRHHHVTYIHPITETKIEVHWRLNPGPGLEPSFEELWNRKSLFTGSSNLVYFLGKEDLFLFLVTHGARHGWSRLRWLLDIHQLVKQEINWKFLKRLLRKNGYLQLGGQALELCSKLFHTEISNEMKALLIGKKPKMLARITLYYLENMVNLHNEPIPKETSIYHRKYLFSIMSLSQKTLFILSLLHPYPTDAMTLPLPKSMHYLYFPLRPFLWILRRKRKNELPQGGS